MKFPWQKKPKEPETASEPFKEAPADVQYHLQREAERLSKHGKGEDSEEEEKAFEFLQEHFPELPEKWRYVYLEEAFKKFQKTVGTEAAEEYVAERLKYLKKEHANELKKEIWGGLFDLYENYDTANKRVRYKTGRTDAPATIKKLQDDVIGL